MSKKYQLFNSEIKVLNIGLEQFADDLKSQGVECVQMDWRPPTKKDSMAKNLLAQLLL